MKNKKLWIAIIAVITVMSLLAGCKAEPLVIKDSETCIVLKTTGLAADADMLLVDYMAQLAEKGQLTYSLTDGMVTSVNGIDNPEDFSSCWMLYTSDAENANAAWGTVEYDGVEYGSAVSGAETLKIKPDQLYIWVFQSF